MEQNQTPLWDAHKNLINKNQDKYDVPIHKGGKIRHKMAKHVEEIFKFDINSSKLVDNLANPTGVIDKSHQLFAKAFKAENAFFLVNGTTSGIHAMLLSTLKPGEKILVPRNVHKSVLNAAIVTGLNLIFMEAEPDNEWMIFHNITLDSVKKSIAKHPDVKAILVLNPTYYGTVSDLKSIVEYAHSKDLLVLCDEAHGSHFVFSDKAPLSAMEAGADISALSIHKTGGSLTQSSAIIWNTKRIKSIQVWNAITLLHSTSPNYLLMSSLDSSRHHLYFHGKDMYKKMCDNANYLRSKLSQIPGIVCFDEKIINKGIYDWDKSKVLINVSGLGLSGFEIHDTLCNQFNIQVELGETNVILLIISSQDTKMKLNRFIKAMRKIYDQQKDKSIKIMTKPTQVNELPIMSMLTRDAFFSDKEEILFKDSLNRISADTMMFYPPGIPALIPGQLITKDIIEYHKWLVEEEAIIINNASSINKVIVVKEK